jgi:hypothetical protein
VAETKITHAIFTAAILALSFLALPNLSALAASNKHTTSAVIVVGGGKAQTARGTTTVGVNRSENVGAGQTITVGVNRSEATGGSTTVGTNRTETVGAGQTITVGRGGSNTGTVGGRAGPPWISRKVQLK